VSAAFLLGCYHNEIPESIELIGRHLYRVKMNSTHENLNNTFIGAAFDWRIATTEEPFHHLPFESFLAISVYRWVAFQHSKVFPVGKEERYYTPTKVGHNLYSQRMQNEQHYIGFLFDWKHRLTEQPVRDLELQSNLSINLLIWLCRFKEWEYEARMEREFYNERMGVPHSGHRRGSEKLSTEP
jgi:hypothetical protein